VAHGYDFADGDLMVRRAPQRRRRPPRYVAKHNVVKI
jgi:hypothetical protein